MVRVRSALALAALSAIPVLGRAQSDLDARIDKATPGVIPQVVAWRRDIHQHPELSGEEVRTAKLVADALRSFGIEVQEHVDGHTGVIGILRGGKPGPVVALRADMDALPVTEEVDVPFKSTVRGRYLNQDVGVMHACGHDSHVAMLLGAAKVLASMKDQIPGTVKFLFQPAEEGLGGAKWMVDGGALENPAPSAIFGLHVFPFKVGEVHYVSGGLMASGDGLEITVHGKQTHGALPWGGVDPVVVASQIVLGLQSVVSRQVDLTSSPAIVTVATIHGGVRANIIPDSVVMTGTVRTFDEKMRATLRERITRTAEEIAKSAGATADVKMTMGTGVTYNDPALTAFIAPTLQRVTGGHAVVGPQTTTSEDFSLYQQKIPGVFFFLGITPPDANPDLVARNHSPKFYVDEDAFPTGVRLLASTAVDYLAAAPRQTSAR